jgi:eukaryotic-like serine/threonine-protein kinase
MSQKPDDYENARTWQQPLPGPPNRPVREPLPDRSTGSDSDDASAVSPVPEQTKIARTSPDAQISILRQAGSGAENAEKDADSTLPIPSDSSADWDALPPPTLGVNRVVFDKYRLLEKIGEGGMGEVWRVWHVTLDAERALKLIKPEHAENEKGWKRFQREARLMAKISHPNAVAVYDFRRTQSVGYIEMEYIRGRAINDVLKDADNQPMPLEWTARLLEQLCSVLNDTHGHLDEATLRPKPIIHRDLKPSNLMVVERKGDTGPPRLKVLDFGIAKIVEDDGSPELTGAGDLVGTPAYMSPEQIRGGLEHNGKLQEIDARSDIYSTGVVLYQLLTGALPFRGGKMALLGAHLNLAPLPMKEANPGASVPLDIERLVMRCLEKDPGKRPQTARELCDQFMRAAGLNVEVPRRSPGGLAWRRWMPAAASAVLLAAAIGITRERGKPAKPSIPTAPAVRADGAPTESAALNVPAVSRKPILWEPKGYAAVDPNNIVPGHAGFPVNLERLDGNVVFVFLKERVYIPEGYEAESLDDLIEDAGWPRVISRKRDKVRFIRVPAAVYRCGDPKPGAPDLDNQGKPLTPHYVSVGGFYIQETEVTNSEIDRYSKERRDGPGIGKWRTFLDKFQIDRPDVTKYPAVSIDYITAKRYAESVGGRLPTEAEWEWAAKSCNEAFWFVWGSEFSQGPANKARLSNPDASEFGPAIVKSYKSDQSDQHVFDFVGNVREMCADTYIPYSERKLEGNSPSNPLPDERRLADLTDPDTRIVVRGGSFMSREDEAKAFYRGCEPPDQMPPDVGFRVVIECPTYAPKPP